MTRMKDDTWVQRIIFFGGGACPHSLHRLMKLSSGVYIEHASSKQNKMLSSLWCRISKMSSYPFEVVVFELIMRCRTFRILRKPVSVHFKINILKKCQKTLCLKRTCNIWYIILKFMQKKIISTVINIFLCCYVEFIVQRRRTCKTEMRKKEKTMIKKMQINQPHLFQI